MRMYPVASSSLSAIGYENGTLVVAFRGGGVYQYSGVPQAVAQGLWHAASKGRYYQSFVRGRYPAMRLG